MARPDATDEELAAAAARARLLPWIASLPQGWDTPVGTHELEGLDQVDEIVILDHGRVAERIYPGHPSHPTKIGS